MDDIDRKYGILWNKILTTIRFQAFHNKCICLTMSTLYKYRINNNNISNYLY